MSHTTDVFLVDRAGMLRARFPFGTGPDVMTAVAREVSATPAVSPTAAVTDSSRERPRATNRAAATTETPSASDDCRRQTLHSASRSSRRRSGPAPPGRSSSRCLWNGVRLADANLRPSVQLASMDGAPIGPTVIGVRHPATRSEGRLVRCDTGDRQAGRLAPRRQRRMPAADVMRGDAVVTVKDPGATAPLSVAAPTAPHADPGRRRWHRPGGHDRPGARPPPVDALDDRCPRRSHGPSSSSSTRFVSGCHPPADERSSWPATCATVGPASTSSTSSRIATRWSPTPPSSMARSAPRR